MRCEARTLDDIRALGGNDAADERRFATAARVSEINLALYRTFAQPVVRAMPRRAGRMAPPAASAAAAIRLVVRRESVDAPVADGASGAREPRGGGRQSVPGGPAGTVSSRSSPASMPGGIARTFAERTFLTVYGNPLLQAALGIDPAGIRAAARGGKDPLHREMVETRIAELKSRIATGDVREGAIRALSMSACREPSPTSAGSKPFAGCGSRTGERPTLAEFKAMVREQYFMLLLDRAATLAAIPKMLPTDAEQRRDGFTAIRQILAASGDIVGEAAERLSQVARLFGLEEEVSPLSFRRPQGELRAKTS